MKTTLPPRPWLLVLAGLLLAGCAPDPKSGRGFNLPPGDPDRGRQTFIDLKCIACHTVDGVELPVPTVKRVTVVLGGEVSRVRTYGRLVSAIIHPAPTTRVRKDRLPSTAAVARPRMPVANDTMTVQQLIDLVTFLQPHYRAIPLEVSDPYAHYGYVIPPPGP